jgi:hypothetical protein
MAGWLDFSNFSMGRQVDNMNGGVIMDMFYWLVVSNNLIYCQPLTIFWNQYFSDWFKPLITFFGM